MQGAYTGTRSDYGFLYGPDQPCYFVARVSLFSVGMTRGLVLNVMDDSTHYSFIDDAAFCFGEAFKIYEAETARVEGSLRFAPLASCCRLLYVALEKGFKHSLALIDPHLLLVKPDRQLILELHKDLNERPAPTIFCSRKPFDTLGLTQTWEALRSLAPTTLDQQVASDFDRALQRFVHVRHKAQHGELFEKPKEVLAVLRQLFARFQSVAGSVATDFLMRLISDNGQLVSRLRAIEADVDADWQVLIDYLRGHGELRMETGIYATLQEDGDHLSVLFGKTNSTSSMSGSADVSLSMANGFFVSPLTKAQELERYSERMRRLAESELDIRNALPNGIEGLVPLETGHLTIPSTSTWLSLNLDLVEPPQLFASAIVKRLGIDFVDPNSVQGNVQGILECAVQKPGVRTEPVFISGAAFFRAEFIIEPENSQESFSHNEYLRYLILTLALSLNEPEPEAFQQCHAPEPPQKDARLGSKVIAAR